MPEFMLAPSFDPLNPKFAPGYRIINIFSNHFSFHSFNKYNDDSLLSRSYQLNNLAIVFLENLLHALIITDTSIRNNVATSVIRRKCGQTLARVRVSQT